MDKPIVVLQGEDPYDNSAQARACLRALEGYPRGMWDGIRLECHNKQEADEIKAAIAALRPDIAVSARWRFPG